MFSDVIENDCSGRHVDAHGERLGGEEHLDETLLKEKLDDLLHDGQNA